MSKTPQPSEVGQSWWLLVHQLPPKPAYLRVKIWRRLQALGAVAIKNAVYVMPANDDTREDLEWVLREIIQGGGEGSVCQARFVDGLSDQDVRALFDTARDADYAAIAQDARDLARALKQPSKKKTRSSTDTEDQVIRLRKRLMEIEAIDFFGANGHEAAEGIVSQLEERVRLKSMAREVPAAAKPHLAELGGKVWVTRCNVHIDRIACAWLVLRFIDPQAQFKFVASNDYKPSPGELRFDMFEAEFTHQGERCSFEVLLAHIGVKDKALKVIAEIVHDIDIKDGKFGRPETIGIKHLIQAIAQSVQDDQERIARGSVVFGDLYQYFQNT